MPGRLLHPAQIVEITGPVIFLAGPIQGAPDWQQTAIELIQQQSSAHIANPRRDYLSGTFNHSEQVDWETHMLGRAARNGVILFWLAAQTEATPGRSYAQTSRFELAEWKVRYEHDHIHLVIGIEAGFGNARYITRRFGQDCPEIVIANSLQAVVGQAINSI